MLRGQQHQRDFVVDRRLHAEAAADVAGNHADLALGHLEHRRQLGAERMHALQRGVDGVAILGHVVVAEAAARLHARSGDAVDHQTMLDDVIGLGECRLGRGLVAEELHETDVVVTVLPHARRAIGAGFGGGDDCGKRLVVRHHQLGRVERLVIGFRYHEGDVVADPARPVLGQRRIRRPEDAAVAPLQSIGHRQVAPSRGLPVFAGEHGEHAGRGLGLGRVDRANARMGVRRAQHVTEHHGGQDHVADIAAAARDQPRILEPGYALTNGKFAHLNPRSGNTCEPNTCEPLALSQSCGEMAMGCLRKRPCGDRAASTAPFRTPHCRPFYPGLECRHHHQRCRSSRHGFHPLHL